MKKVLLAAAVVSATCMGSISSAMASDWFVGVEAGKAKHKMSIEQTGVKNFSKKMDHTDYGLRVGKYLNDNVRTYATITTGKDDGKAGGSKVELKSQSLLMSADYLFGDGNLKPFVGASVGANRTKGSISGMGSKTENAFAYGAQAGVVYNLGSVDLEGGYRYMKHNTDFKLDGGKIKNKDTQKVYLSASYRF